MKFLRRSFLSSLFAMPVARLHAKPEPAIPLPTLIKAYELVIEDMRKAQNRYDSTDGHERFHRAVLRLSMPLPKLSYNRELGIVEVAQKSVLG